MLEVNQFSEHQLNSIWNVLYGVSETRLIENQLIYVKQQLNRMTEKTFNMIVLASKSKLYAPRYKVPVNVEFGKVIMDHI